MRWTLCVLVGCGLVSACAGSGAASAGPGAAGDVRIGRCIRDPASGYPDVAGTITNHTSRWNDYSVVVVMRQAGRPVWAPDMTVVAVPPRQSQQFTGGDSRHLGSGAVTCSVATVDRTVRP